MLPEASAEAECDCPVCYFFEQPEASVSAECDCPVCLQISLGCLRPVLQQPSHTAVQYRLMCCAYSVFYSCIFFPVMKFLKYFAQHKKGYYTVIILYILSCPQYLLDKLQKVQNNAARLVLRVS